MSTVTAYVCTNNPGTYKPALTAYNVPTCADAGIWQQIVIADPFDVSALSASELGDMFGCGFVVLATGLVIVWAGKQILRAIRSSF